jgi:hypothetical protein
MPKEGGHKHAARFDEMAYEVLEWESGPNIARLLSEGEGGKRGRLGTILRGCFDGARRREVVEVRSR